MHTELFTEYIANNGDNALPELFDKVPDVTVGDTSIKFSETFILRFANREIGFETESLFALRFESKAREVIPFYVDKLKRLDEIEKAFSLKTENTRTETLTATNNTESKDFIYPDGEPVTKGALNNSNTGTANGTTTRTETEMHNLTPLEREELYKRVADDPLNVWEEIFSKFDNLFLAVL